MQTRAVDPKCETAEHAGKFTFTYSMRFCGFFLKRKLHQTNLSVLILGYGAIFILPMLYSSATIDPVLLPRFLALSVLTFLLVLLVLIVPALNGAQIDLSVLYRSIFPISLCYIAISGLSGLWSINPVEAMFEWLKLVLLLAFLSIASLIMAKSRDSLEIVSRAIVVTGLYLGLIGFGQSAEIAFLEIPGNYGIYATMANKNLLASALFMTLPFTLFGLLRFRGLWHVLSFLNLIMTTYLITVVQTRTVWIAIAVSSCLTLVGPLVLQKKSMFHGFSWFQLKNRIIVILLGILIALGAPAINRALNLSTQSVPVHYLSTGSPGTETNHAKQLLATDTLRERLKLWRKTIRMAADHPLSGVGPGQWRIILPAYGFIQKIENTPTGVREIWFQRPHNDFLWVLAENGVPGFLCYTVFFAVLLFYGLKVAVYSKDVEMKLFAIAMVFGLIGYTIIAALSFPKERIFHSVLFALTAASVISAYHRTFPSGIKSVDRNIIFIVGMFFLIPVAFCLVFGYLRLISDVHVKNAISTLHQHNWQKVVAEIDHVNPLVYNLDPSSMPVRWYRGMAYFELGKLAVARKDFKTAERANPYHIHVLNNLGVCSALEGEFVLAHQYYNRLLSIAPDFRPGISNLKHLNLIEQWDNKANKAPFFKSSRGSSHDKD